MSQEIENKVNINTTAFLEQEIGDLRHQLITSALYNRENSYQFVDKLKDAPPIIVTESQQTDGEIITLFLDNSWGIKYKKIFSNEVVPYMVRETWAGIRMPGLASIIDQFWDHYNANCDALDANRISSQSFMETDDALNIWLLNKKHNFVEKHSTDILSGIYYDLSLTLELAKL